MKSLKDIKETNLLDNSSDYDMKITGNRYSGFQTPHDKIFGTPQGVVSVEDKIFGKSRGIVSPEDKIFGNTGGFNKNLFNTNTNFNMNKFFNTSSGSKNSSGHNKINMMLGGANLNSNKIIGQDKKSKSNIAKDYDMNKYFSMNTSNGNDKISMMMGSQKQNNNLNFENKMKMFLPSNNNTNNFDVSNKLNMYLPKRIGRDIYGKSREGDIIVTPEGEAIQTYGTSDIQVKQDTSFPLETYNKENKLGTVLLSGIESTKKGIQKLYKNKPNTNKDEYIPVEQVINLETYNDKVPSYRVKKENPIINYIKQGVESGIESIPNAIQRRQERLNQYRQMEKVAINKYLTNPASLTPFEQEMLLNSTQKRPSSIRQWAGTAADNYLEGVEKASFGFRDVNRIPIEQNVGTLMGGWRDYTKVPVMKVGGVGRDQIFKQGKKSFIMTPEGPVEVPKGYLSQMRVQQPQQYEKIYNPVGIFSSKVDFAMPTSQPTNIPVVQYMSRIPQGTGGFETMSKTGSGLGFSSMAGLGNIETGGGAVNIDNMLNNVQQQMKAQPVPQPVPQIPAQPVTQMPVVAQETMPQEVKKPTYSTGPRGQPPQPGMKWSENSKKWVWYERAPYNKHQQPQPQQYGG